MTGSFFTGGLIWNTAFFAGIAERHGLAEACQAAFYRQPLWSALSPWS